MLQKFKMGLMCLGLFFSANCLAINYNLMPGIHLSYEIPPNKPLEFTNVWFWTITATCKATTEDDIDKVLVEALSKTGKIDGKVIAEGESVLLDIHSGDNIELAADSGAKVRLTNQGEHALRINCSV